MPDDGVQPTSIRVQFRTALCAVIIGFFTYMAASGMYYSFGAIFPVLLDRYGASRFSTALVGSSQEFVYAGACLPVPRIINRCGLLCSYIAGAILFVVGLFLSGYAESLEMWTFTYGFVTTTGMAFTFMVAIEVLYRYTPRRFRGLCVGIAFAGTGTGAAAIAPAFTASERARGISATMLWCSCIIGGIMVFVVIVLGMTARFGYRFIDPKLRVGSPSSRNAVEKRRTSWVADGLSSTRQWFSNCIFSGLFIALCLYLFGFMVPFAHLLQYTEDLGLDNERGAMVLSLLGACSAFGRILFGSLGDWTNKYLHCFIWTVLQNSIAVLALPLCRSFEALLVFAVCCGSSAGGRAGLLALVCFELFGQDRASSAYAMLCLCFCFSQTLGSPLAGALHDLTGSYSSAFLAAGMIMASSVPVLLLVARHRAKSEVMNTESAGSEI